MPTKLPTPPEGARVTPAATPEDQPVVSAKGTRDGVRLGSETDPAEISERITLIAHDLKTPLSIIMLETELLGERLPLDQLPAVQHGLERITQNAAYIDRLVADLLDLASVDAGQLQLQLRIERVHLGVLLKETLDRAVSSVDRERVRLDIRYDCFVRADRNRLERVLANFISNALKYSGSPITIVLEIVGTRARVTVIDQGRGLTPDQAATVFDRYRRATNTRGRDGHGLGLYISRKIIDAHAGQIGVDSAPSVGSQFYFELDIIE
ncbi:MAG: HAMP domain-containing histidine kinase [Myxococcota bacterium]|nr:HAMP domain-containing histidine kinase [Myxococcota bacterium]